MVPDKPSNPSTRAILSVMSAVVCSLFASCDRYAEPGPVSPIATQLTIADNGRISSSLKRSWVIDTVPLLRIGAGNNKDGPRFVNLKSIARMPEGVIIAADVRTQSVYAFDSTGRQIRMWGGAPGDGPGEFERLVLALGVNTDTIVAIETLSLVTINVLSIRNGFVMRSVWNSDSLNRLAGEVKGVITSPNFMDNGAMLLSSAPAPLSDGRESSLTSHRDTVRIVWIDRDRSTRRILGNRARSARIEYVSKQGGGTGTIGISIPNAPDTRMAWDPAGRRVCIGDQQYPVIECYDRDMTGIAVRWSAKIKLTPDSVVRNFRDEVIATFAKRAGPDGTELNRVVDKLDFSKIYRVFGELKVDSDLNLWVDMPMKRQNGSDDRVFSIFSREGLYLHDVVVPFGIFLNQIYSDRAYGVYMDDDGIQYIAAFRLIKPSR